MPKPRTPDAEYGDQEVADIAPESVNAIVGETPVVPTSEPVSPPLNSIDDIAARNEEWED